MHSNKLSAPKFFYEAFLIEVYDPERCTSEEDGGTTSKFVWNHIRWVSFLTEHTKFSHERT